MSKHLPPSTFMAGIRITATILSAATLTTALSCGAALAQSEPRVPQFRASCPMGILAAGGGNTVFINGKQADVRVRGANSFTARIPGTEIDFLFSGGEPSMSYTAANGANGICTITKFQPSPSRPSQSPGGIDTAKMSSVCKGFASEKYGVRPSYVSVHPAFRDHGMYSMYGNADGKNFICTFNGQGKFVGVDSSGNPDGDL